MQTAPEWLTLRDGSLKPGLADHILLVMMSGQLLYRLEVVPASGKLACKVLQSNNGKRLDDPATTFATKEEAVQGGLEQLRTKLGW